MDTLQQATQLLQPFMGETRRGTWLTLAFYEQDRHLYDAIPLTGATRDFTVRCVRLLLERGCLGARHALSLLLEVVSVEAGDEQRAAFQALILALDRPCSAQHAPASPVTAMPAGEAPAALAELRAALAAAGPIPALPAATLEAILRYPPADLAEYRLARIAEWSQPRYALDRRFTRLTLLLDQGRDAQGLRWQPQPQPFDDLRQVLAAAGEPALVLLGPPGCGKSSLLRRLELDLAVAALQGDSDEPAALSLFLPLNRWRPSRREAPLPLPQDWLAQEWACRYPRLPALDTLLAGGRLVLLLDAVNEIPHQDEADYRGRIALWRDWLAELSRRVPGTRVLFSCRSLDYSATLSTPELSVPHVRVEPLSDPQVEDFLNRYNPEQGPALWAQLRGTPQLELFRSPFYLTLLLAQAQAQGMNGTALSGRAALFTGFVRQALLREIEADHPAFRPGPLLDGRDHQRLLRHDWRSPWELPSRGALLPALGRLAFQLQARRAPGETSRVRVPYDEALALLGGAPQGEALLHAGVALQVLEVQWDDVFYLHQLLQEYFAARALAAAPQPQLAASPWRAAALSPRLEEVLQGLGDADPLPGAPTTGWEETCLLAAAMTQSPASWVAALAEVNLPLAGRCAAQPDVTVPPERRRPLQQALVARSRDPAADLRARIAAGRALAELGDPRLERRQGPHGDFLAPSLVAVPAGSYPLGSDEGLYEDEAPAHRVALSGFGLGRFPVSNAEWRCFLEAGGYEEERWWEGEAARRWRRGEGTAEGPKQEWREFRQGLRDHPEQLQQWLSKGQITSQQAEAWERIRTLSDDAFESLLEEWYPPGRQTQPAYWSDTAFSHPSQPVVGVCWHEARAYCAWLSAQSGRVYRLPSEAEWEGAARGIKGRRFPWGDRYDPTRCNGFESHIRGTTPVGVIPAGDTPEGLADMGGNVWEWTSSAYQPYPYVADERENQDLEAARRVVRGGSWGITREYLRCAYRAPNHPDGRYYDLGLRLLCVSPIS